MKRQSLFGQGAIGTIGSYSSLFAFLLVASVLAYRNIFDLVIDFAQRGLPSLLVDLTFVMMMVIFVGIFIAVPAIPTTKEISANFKEKNRRMAWMLILLATTYEFALFFQLIYFYLDNVGKLW
jgi:hypothetical protein